jgi:hypothetical protein
MSDATMDAMVQIAIQYMESDLTTPETSGVLGHVTGAAITEYFGEDAAEEFRKRVQDHGRQLLMSMVEDLFDA